MQTQRALAWVPLQRAPAEKPSGRAGSARRGEPLMRRCRLHSVAQEGLLRNLTKENLIQMETYREEDGAYRPRRRSRRRRRAWSISWLWILVLAVGAVALWYRPLVTSGAMQAPPPSGGESVAVEPSDHAAEDTADAEEDTAWTLLLANKWTPIPEGYTVELKQLSNGQSVDTRIYPALQEMFDAARADGVYPVVASGYRTAEKQQSLMDEKIAALTAEGYSPQEAKREAETWVAVPGTSEHQLGLAVDINADGIHSAGNQVYAWLQKNAHRFGFIRRYPPDKTAYTGVSDEPWHYRYVGVENAAEMTRQNLCLEEFLEQAEGKGG